METKIFEKATKAEKLRTSEAFKTFLSEVVEQQLGVFKDASAKEDQIAEAHAMIRALDKIKAQMDRAVNDAKHVKRRQAKKS